MPACYFSSESYDVRVGQGASFYKKGRGATGIE